MNRRRRYTWIWAVPVVLAALGVGWVGVSARQARDRAEPARAREQGRPLPVRTAVVEERSFEDVIGATAITVASETASIWVGPRVGVRDALILLSAVNVVEGQFAPFDKLQDGDCRERFGHRRDTVEGVGGRRAYPPAP